MSTINRILTTHIQVPPFGDCACGFVPDGPFVDHLELEILNATGAEQ